MIYTFYSYKGGVGRSMALANVAAWLCDQGLRVVLIDWDLEAPGIESYFYQSEEDLEDVRSTLGLIDLLMSYKRMYGSLHLRAGSAPEEAGEGAPSSREPDRPTRGDELDAVVSALDRVLPPLSHSLYPIRSPGRGSDGGSLSLLPAGWRAGARFKMYAEAVQRFDWAEFYAAYQGEAYFEWMRRQLLREEVADVVLIDSRTGVTEMGGVCTRQLADVVVCLCASNTQNLEGVARMIASFNRDAVVARRRRSLEAVLVPSRVDNFNTTQKNIFEEEFRRRLDSYTPPAFRTLKTSFWNLRIPYISDYAYRERLAIGDPDADKDLVEVYKKLTAHLVMLAPGGSALRRWCRDEVSRVFGAALPEVFIAYEGAEQRPLAAEVRARLERARITVWPDPDEALTAAVNSERETHGALDQSKAMVLLITQSGLDSGWVKRTWRAARERGVRVFPIVEDPGTWAAHRALPAWMRESPTWDLAGRSEALLRQLMDLSPVQRVPSMAPRLPPRYVERPEELRRIKEKLLISADGSGAGSPDMPPSVALWGPAGTGKTILAAAVCHDDDVIDHFSDGIVWVPLGAKADFAAALRKIIAAFTGDVSPHLAEEEAARQLERLLESKRCLLVLEDAYEPQQLLPFLRGARRCVRLITSRDLNPLVAINTPWIPIGALSAEQATTLLTRQLDRDAPPAPVRQLSEIVGGSPFAIDLVNQELRKRLAQGEQIEPALAALAEGLQRAGSAIIDQPGTADTRASLQVSVELTLSRLSAEDRVRLESLVTAPASHAISLAEASIDWDIDALDANECVQRLADLALVDFDKSAGTVRLYPAVRLALLSHPKRSGDGGAAARTSEPARVTLPTQSGPAAMPSPPAPPSPPDQSASTTPAEPWRRSRPRASWLLIASAASMFLVGLAGLYAMRRPPTQESFVSSNLSKATLPPPPAGFMTDPLRHDSKLAQAYRESGRCFAASGELEKAVEAYTSAIEADASDATFYLDRGELYERQGKAMLAMDDYEKASELDPKSADARILLGSALLRKGDLAAALAAWTNASSIAPSNPVVYLNRAQALALQGNNEEALAAYSKAIQLEPEQADAYFGRGRLHEQAKQTALAIEDFKMILTLSSADPNTAKAAQARLKELGALKEPPAAIAAKVKVYLHFARKDDADIVKEIRSALAAKHFEASSGEHIAHQSQGDIRYFFKADLAKAELVKETVESSLAKKGIPTRVALLYRDANRFPSAKPGRIEVWLPSLQQPPLPASLLARSTKAE
ncbi:KGGVGR-motif variant AAA ATPase [Sorangium sp. KYC3313]|uniref:KGGVGR-motif variant AAA ATPase n=1 Tax=Sorangium sp. KYC3313 TaxID=3449740 RepID=UPI003F886493